METEELTQLVITVLEAHKAINITVLDVTKLSNLIDTMVICSATSTRHASSMADKLVHTVKQVGVKPFSVAGKKEGEWILIDLTDVVVHIMLPDIREFYSLEKLWNTTIDTRSKNSAGT